VVSRAVGDAAGPPWRPSATTTVDAESSATTIDERKGDDPNLGIVNVDKGLVDPTR
jgi:hypothetical protein